MKPLRVCDACSIRRVKCDGQDPCGRCATSGLECRRLRTRKKMGPKTFRAKTLDRLVSEGVYQKRSSQEQAGTEDPSAACTCALPDSAATLSIPLHVLRPYLDIYGNKMYPVWPVLDVACLIERLQKDPFDEEANVLAISACTATILQLQLTVEDIEMPLPDTCINKIEAMRAANQYRRRPTLNTLLTSFFLHIAYLHAGQQSISTLLLREAIAMAHLIGLHQASYYADQNPETQQANLRILWLLFITERAHARQYDLPHTLTISPALPELQDQASSPAFASLCKMFECFDTASSVEDIVGADRRLQLIPMATKSYNSIQQADLIVTQQWMRLLLWKLAVSSQTMTMTADATGTLHSIVFPVQVARDLLSNIAPLSADALKAHGPGMEMKLFSLATSLADVVTCMPTHSAVTSQWGAIECLAQISNTLHSLQGSTSGAVVSVLHQRLVEIGLDCMFYPEPASPASDDIGCSKTATSLVRVDAGYPSAEQIYPFNSYLEFFPRSAI